MTPWFIATEKFDQTNAGWEKYITWSGLEQLDEVVSLDGSLCPTVLPNVKEEYWKYIVNEDLWFNSLSTSITFARKQRVFTEKTCSVFFAILLAILARKFRKDSNSSATTSLIRIRRSVPLRIVADFQKHSPMASYQKTDSSERMNVPEKCRTPYVSNTLPNITRIAIYGPFSAVSNTSR